jgi:glycerol-1-phosphate dehydrogenase [NAD(P)+]
VGKYLYDKGMLRIALYVGDGIVELVGGVLLPGLEAHGVEIIHKQIVASVDVDEITHSAFTLPSVHAIVGVGGGKALDFAKYTAHLLHIPFISVPTAISNDGFGSSGASLTVRGKRKSVKAASPFGIVIDLNVIKDSPDIFMYSGIGDMLSKITALRDWQTARDRGLARYVDFSAMMAYNSLDILFLKHTFDIHCEPFQRCLASSLLYSGVAMEIAGSSRPASGSEHLISHALDELSPQPKMHGIQVGVATYLCALLQNNEQTADIREVFEQTGLLEFIRRDPFDYSEFAAALRLAPTLKNDFYTVLSEPDSYTRALEFIKNDPLLKTVIVA